MDTINSIEYIELARVLITCSNDCTIRVWTVGGKYIGTFGQDENWNLYDPKTYKHPLVPCNFTALIIYQAIVHYW